MNSCFSKIKRIAILGSTGSIGRNALRVVRNYPDKFRVVALTTGSDIATLKGQLKEFRPDYACVSEPAAAKKLKSQLGKNSKIFQGEGGLLSLLRQEKIDQVLLAISGSAALRPLLAAIAAGRQIALANKEALVMAGALVMLEAQKKKAQIIPVDSEQSAIWQCLAGQKRSQLRKIYLTASGGPFLKTRGSALKNVSIAKVLNHPRWKMGRKISVDSANLMNKGLEVLEAIFLFGASVEKIKVLIHPQAIIHSMVEFIDGVVLAQLSATDMRIPIQYALTYPERLPELSPGVDFYKLKALNFQPPDFKKFPCLGLAYRAASELGTMPAVMNAANEVCVGAFLNKQLDFSLIPEVIEKVMDRHKSIAHPALNDILAADGWARKEAYAVIQN